jgi:hypothetical protein
MATVTYNSGVSPNVVFALDTGSDDPPTYIYDPSTPDYYVVSVADDWSTANNPTTLQIWIWQKRNGIDTVIGTIPLIGVNDVSQTMAVTSGQSVSIEVEGHCPYISATIHMAGGSSPTFSGTVLFDGIAEP